MRRWSTDARHWRRELHKIPELQYDVVQTAKFVADRLHAFGCDEVRMFVGRSGVVGVIKGRGGEGPAIALRADMDALPIEERTNLPYRSTIPGKMHACGHDGHTAMLLGAARHLAKTRAFRGTAVVVFQPAEEGGAGAKAMLEDGLVERFGVTQFFGMHNWPGLPLGAFAIRKGAILAASDKFTIALEGKGGHAAMPHRRARRDRGGVGNRAGAAKPGLARSRPARFGRRVGVEVRGGDRLQRAAADGDAARHGAHAEGGDARPSGGAAQGDCRGRRRRARHRGENQLRRAAIRRR